MLKQKYDEEGFVVCQNLLSPEEVSELKAEITDIIKQGKIKGLSALKEEEQEMEESEIIKRYLAFHFPHKMSDKFLKVMSHPKIVGILTEIIGPDVKAMQTMVFVKGPGKPGQAWHQDEYYIATRDRSLCGAWIALDNATISNGCLWVIPRSHRPAIIWRQHVHNDARFDNAGEAYGYPFSDDEAVAVELGSGGIVFFNGYLLHRSLPNVTPDQFRRALAIHYMSAHSPLPWNWDGRLDYSKDLAEGCDMRDIVMIAGEDPYAWKGTQSLTYPYIRAETRSAASSFDEL